MARTQRGSGKAAALWSALIPLLVILIQAGSVLAAPRNWALRGAMPPGTRGSTGPSGIDVVLLAAGLVGVLIWRPADVLGTALLLIIWLFGVIEFINYFVMRLAYPVSRWFAEVGQRRTPRLISTSELTRPGPVGCDESAPPDPKHRKGGREPTGAGDSPTLAGDSPTLAAVRWPLAHRP